MSSATAKISATVHAILAAADAEIASHVATGGAVCQSSGRCCRFEEYGHRLYVTAAEAAHFQAVHGNSGGSTAATERGSVVALPQFFAQGTPTGCPYQVGGLCTAREARPLGCRIYFCDERSKAWQNEVYEKYHGQLKAAHESLRLPYRYLEWREALREMMANA